MHRSKSCVDNFYVLNTSVDLEADNRKSKNSKLTHYVKAAPNVSSSYYQPTLQTSGEISQDKSSLISFRRAGSLLLDSFRPSESVLQTEQSMSIIAKHLITDSQPSQSELVTDPLASYRVRRKHSGIRPDELRDFAKKPITNPRITLDQLLQGIELKRIGRAHCNPQDRLPALNNKNMATLKHEYEPLVPDSKEETSRRIATEPAEYSNHISQLHHNMLTNMNSQPVTRGISLPKLKIRRNNSELSDRKYCKFKPSLLDLLTDGCSQQANQIYCLDKSISKIKCSEKYSKNREESKNQDSNGKHISKNEPRIVKRRADLFKYISTINTEKKPVLELKIPTFIPQETEDEEGKDAEDRAADSLILSLSKYPFNRILLRLNRQVTMEFHCEDRKRKSPIKMTKAKFTRLREKLREALLVMKKLKLTMHEVITNTIFSLHPFEKEYSHNFLRAARTGNYTRLEDLLKYNRYLLFDFNNIQQTALHIAILNDHTSCCELLIQNGADVNATDMLGRTPLYVAIEKDNLDVVKMLLHAQCNPWSEGDTDYRKILNENPAAKYYVSKARQLHILIKMTPPKIRDNVWEKKSSANFLVDSLNTRRITEFQKERDLKLEERRSWNGYKHIDLYPSN